MTTFVHQIYTKMLAIPAQWTTVQPPHFCLRQALESLMHTFTPTIVTFGHLINSIHLFSVVRTLYHTVYHSIS
jgi:hypothetical protein